MNKPYKIYNSHVTIEQGALDQMDRAMSLPISVQGALMPDAHTGYGLPIGGVWLTKNAIVPYAVGVDIGCSVRYTEMDAKYSDFSEKELENILQRETVFGVGGEMYASEHALLQDLKSDEELHYTVEKLLRACEKDPFIGSMMKKLVTQMGTSGSGNHFVEFGTNSKGNLCFVSHSGSRGTGAAVCAHYTKIAKELHPELIGEEANLAWLPIDLGTLNKNHEGDAYFNSMYLMNVYALLNHRIIAHRIIRRLKKNIITAVANSHNFAEGFFAEDGSSLILHRKGATPAHYGSYGYIPGTMRDPGYLVQGKGVQDSLNSCSHGAGRAMSRKKAKESFKSMDNCGVNLISAGRDEHPDAYKNIADVMESQKDLISIEETFTPRIVKMAPANEKAED